MRSGSVFGLLGTRRVDLLNCLDDEAATERARLLAKEHSVEVWEGVMQKAPPCGRGSCSEERRDAITRRLANVGQWGSGVYAEHVVGFCAGERAISGFGSIKPA